MARLGHALCIVALVIVAGLPSYQAGVAFVEAQREVTAPFDAVSLRVQQAINARELARLQKTLVYPPLQVNRGDFPLPSPRRDRSPTPAGGAREDAS